MDYQFPLSKREEELLELLWRVGRPMTSIEILADPQSAWKESYVKTLLRTLLQRGVLQVCGVKQQGTNNLRLYAPAFSREEYVAKIITERLTTRSQIPAVAAALAKETGANDEELVGRLQDLIQELRKEK